MTWICPLCGEELGELNGWCEYCKAKDGSIIYNPDKWYVREIRIRHLMEGAKAMTPQEELFLKLFNEDKLFVKDMTDLELRAEREKLVEVIQRAKIGVSAIDSTDDDRKKARRKSEGPKGFERSVNIDDASTEAINKIKERQKRLSKAEQVQLELKKLYETAGASSNEASALVNMATSNRKIVEAIKKDEADNILRGPAKADSFIMTRPEIATDKSDKPAKQEFVNPFAKKE